MNEPSIVDAKTIVDLSEFRGIEGRVLTIVESIGLPEKQEAALKGLIRQAIWHNDFARFYIWPQSYDKVYAFMREIDKGRVAQSMPRKSK